MQPGVVSLNEKDIHLIGPQVALLGKIEIGGCDVELENASFGRRHGTRRQCDFGYVARLPDGLPEAILQRRRFLVVLVAGAVAEGDVAASSAG